MLRLEDVTLTVGSHEVLHEASFHLRPGDRVGLVGRNGAGKTTLLRALTGALPLDSGKRVQRGGIDIGTLPQDAVSGSSRPLWEEAASGMTRMHALKARLDAAQAAVEAHADGAALALAEATEAWHIVGGYALDERIGSVLHGLGFGTEDWQRSCDTFSGGWQMRIALARLLLSEPNVLLLDEPTNHLDLHARSWLTGFLSRSDAAMVVVSHDRHLLDAACTRIVEVSHRQLHAFSGNFSAWLVERDVRFEQARAAYEAQQEEIARLERFVTRFKGKPTKASQAMSRQKRLDKMVRLEPPRSERAPRLRLPDAVPSSFDPITLRDASFGWDGTDVLTEVDVVIERGMKLAVLGLNGSGKSTLLHALAGRLPLSRGRRVPGESVRMGVFSQDLAQALPTDLSALDAVLAAAPAAGRQQARTALGALGLSGDMALREVGRLSGGEKARVALARFAVRPYNVLLLDEPTNHLDAVTVEVLVGALKAFEGALVLVSHDRWAVEQLATHVALVRDGGVDLRLGLRPEDFDLDPPERDPARPAAGDDYADRKRQHRARERAQRRIAEIGGEIEAAEAEVARLETRLFEVAADHEAALAVVEEQRGAQRRVDALYAEWESLEEH